MGRVAGLDTLDELVSDDLIWHVMCYERCLLIFHPELALRRILDYLVETKDKVALRSTCKSLREAVDANSSFEVGVSDSTGGMSSVSHLMPRQLRLIDLTEPIEDDAISTEQMRNLRKITAGFGGAISRENYLKILCAASRINELVLGGNALEYSSFLAVKATTEAEKRMWKQLETLVIQQVTGELYADLERSRMGFSIVRWLRLLDAPNVSTFRFFGGVREGEQTNMSPLLSGALINFIARSKNIKTFSALIRLHGSRTTSAFPLPKVTIPALNIHQLQRVNVSCSEHDMPVWVQAVNQLRSLVSLRLNVLRRLAHAPVPKEVFMTDHLDDVLWHCRRTLRSVDLDGLRVRHGIDGSIFGVIKNLQRLVIRRFVAPGNPDVTFFNMWSLPAGLTTFILCNVRAPTHHLHRALHKMTDLEQIRLSNSGSGEGFGPDQQIIQALASSLKLNYFHLRPAPPPSHPNDQIVKIRVTKNQFVSQNVYKQAGIASCDIRSIREKYAHIRNKFLCKPQNLSLKSVADGFQTTD